MQRIKGVSSHRINALLSRSGALWTEESFDRIIRGADDLEKKVTYIVMNPVAAGLVQHPDDYPWLWRSWVEGNAQL